MSSVATLGTSGERARKAGERVGAASAELVLALRRSLPFLTRKRVGVVAEPARCALFASLPSVVPDTAFEVPFTVAGTRPGQPEAASLVFDRIALVRLLGGVFGTEDEAPEGPASRPMKLSAAQSVLASRLCNGVLRAFMDVIEARLGIATSTAGADEPAKGPAAVVVLALAGGGRIALAVSIAALAVPEAAPPAPDARMAAVLEDVEVDVIAQLGTVRMALDAITKLSVGDVVPLALGLNERATVCAGGSILFRGRPTAAGTVIGIAIE